MIHVLIGLAVMVVPTGVITLGAYATAKADMRRERDPLHVVLSQDAKPQ